MRLAAHPSGVDCPKQGGAVWPCIGRLVETGFCRPTMQQAMSIAWLLWI
jgi:hypothetical protein